MENYRRADAGKNPVSRQRLRCCLILITPLTVMGQVDRQWWNEAKASYTLGPRVTVHLKTELRFVQDVSALGVYNYLIGGQYGLNRHWQLQGNLKRELVRIGDSWRPEWRLELFAKLSGRLWSLPAGLDNRLEIRRFPTETRFRLRQKVRLESAFTVRALIIRPYLHNELFHSFHEGRINQNRLTAGLSWPVSANLSTGLYFRLKSDLKGEHWQHVAIVGTSLSYRLR